MAEVFLVCDVLPSGRAADVLFRELSGARRRGVSCTVLTLGPDRWQARRRARRAGIPVVAVHDAMAQAPARGLLQTVTRRLAGRRGAARPARWRTADDALRSVVDAPAVPAALRGRVVAPARVPSTADDVRRADGTVAIRSRRDAEGLVFQRDFVRADGRAYLVQWYASAGSDEPGAVFAFDHASGDVHRHASLEHWEAAQVRALVPRREAAVATLGRRSAAVLDLLVPDLGVPVRLDPADPLVGLLPLLGLRSSSQDEHDRSRA